MSKYGQIARSYQLPLKKITVDYVWSFPELDRGFAGIVHRKEAIRGISQILVEWVTQSENFRVLIAGSMPEQQKGLLWMKMELLETEVSLPIWICSVLLVDQLHVRIL